MTTSGPWPARAGAAVATLAVVLLVVSVNRDLVWLGGVPVSYRAGLQDLPAQDVVGAPWLPARLAVPVGAGIGGVVAAWLLAVVAASRARWARLLVIVVVVLVGLLLVVAMAVALAEDARSGADGPILLRGLGLGVGIVAAAALVVLLAWRWRRAAAWVPLLAAGVAVAGFGLFVITASGPAEVGPGPFIALGAALVALVGALLVAGAARLSPARPG